MIPHLTWFTAPHCARPVRQHKKKNSIRRRFALRRGIHPCCSGLQVQGSAISPAGMAYFHSRSTADRNSIPHFWEFCKGVLKDSRKFHIWEMLKRLCPTLSRGRGQEPSQTPKFLAPFPRDGGHKPHEICCPIPHTPWLGTAEALAEYTECKGHAHVRARPFTFMIVFLLRLYFRRGAGSWRSSLRNVQTNNPCRSGSSRYTGSAHPHYSGTGTIHRNTHPLHCRSTL